MKNEFHPIGLFNSKCLINIRVQFEAKNKKSETKPIEFQFQVHNENDRMLIKTFVEFVNDKLALNDCEQIKITEEIVE